MPLLTKTLAGDSRGNLSGVYCSFHLRSGQLYVHVSVALLGKTKTHMQRPAGCVGKRHCQLTGKRQ